jgi:hypothetical protein
MMAKQFATHTVISAGTGILMVEDAGEGFGNIYDICEYMTGEEGLFTHQLVRVSREIQPYLQEQFPWLAEFEALWENRPKSLNHEDGSLGRWCRKTVQYFTMKYGKSQTVHPMHLEDHQQIDPQTELLMMVHESKIITMDPETGEITKGLPDDYDEDR